MSNRDFADTRLESLAQLLRMDADTPEMWTAAELADVFEHQLRTPLECCLPELDGPWAAKTFGQLLHDPAPPLEFLDEVKKYAKTCGAEGDSLPKQVAGALYLAAIASALLHCGKRITAADAGSLATKLKWGQCQPWIDSRTQALLEQALRHVD